MSKFKSAIHNIGHHAVSGLSDFLQEAYEICNTQEKWVFELDLLSGICTPLEVNSSNSFCKAISNLKQKYQSILSKSSGVKANDVEQAIIKVDFLVNDKRYMEHKKKLNYICVWYGHDPIYQFTITVKLKNGQVCREIFSR